MIEQPSVDRKDGEKHKFVPHKLSLGLLIPFLVAYTTQKRIWYSSQVCNHPFLVDPDLSSSLLENVKETEYLDVGIKASGKLQLLETLLLEMKKRGWRVLILYEV